MARPKLVGQLNTYTALNLVTQRLKEKNKDCEKYKTFKDGMIDLYSAYQHLQLAIRERHDITVDIILIAALELAASAMKLAIDTDKRSFESREATDLA